jgi:chromosome segregation ATPase
MSEHDERADELEHELDDMERRTDRLENEIGDVREDWERKKRDSRIPGAAGDPDSAEKGPQPETNYPSKGDED